MRNSIIGLLAVVILSLSGVSAQAALGDYFVTTDWLAQNRDKVTLVDVRKAPMHYLGHIDGAHHVGRDRFLSRRDGIKSLVPTASEFIELANQLGITRDSLVVAYAEDKNPYAARFVWTLRFHGHENAYVLDGGYEKWAQENRPTAILPTSAASRSYYQLAVTSSAQGDTRAESDYLLTRVEDPAVVVWDTRRSAEYAGTEVRADRGGHIPGATHLNWTELQKEVNGVKVLKSREEIVALLSNKGLTPDKEIIAHCQTGIRSAYATLVLLGLDYPQAKNYDGSWIEWANNPTLPIIAADGKQAARVTASSSGAVQPATSKH